MSVRLPLLKGSAQGTLQQQPARPARSRIERRAVTVCSGDASALSFARALAAALASTSTRDDVVLIASVEGQGSSAGARRALDEALAGAASLVVVAEPTLAVELSGCLDLWVGPRPRLTASAELHAAHASSQLEVRTTSASSLAPHLASALIACLRSPAA